MLAVGTGAVPLILLTILGAGCAGNQSRDRYAGDERPPACLQEASVSYQLAHPWTDEQLKQFGGNPPPLFLFHFLDDFMGRVTLATVMTVKDIAPDPGGRSCGRSGGAWSKDKSEVVPRRWYARMAGLFHKAPMVATPVLPVTLASNLVETFTAKPAAAAEPMPPK